MPPGQIRCRKPERRIRGEAALIVYGQNPVREALRGRRKVLRLWSTAAPPREWNVPRHIDAVRSSRDEIERICGSPEHQGVCAEVEPYRYTDADFLLNVHFPPPGQGKMDVHLLVALDEVQDPHNLGAVCRVAEVAGAAGVVIPERRSAEVTPAVCKASAGAVEHLAIARVRNLSDFLTDAKKRDAWVYGADASGIPYDQPDYAGLTVLVLGAEGKGLRPRVADACD